MDRKNFGYSLKNIPIPSRNSYLKNLISKVDSFIHRIRWKAFFFDKNNEQSENNNYVNFRFASEKTPPQNPALTPFENDLYDLINNLSFTKHKSTFQKQLSKDAKEIRNSTSLYVPADKTTNLYKLQTESYKKLLNDNITKDYKKTEMSTKRSIDQEAKKIANALQLDERIECLVERETFITLKDHKENFENNPKCRLLNPAKSEIGRVSKAYLQKNQ